jgi:hypothetical protein
MAAPAAATWSEQLGQHVLHERAAAAAGVLRAARASADVIRRERIARSQRGAPLLSHVRWHEEGVGGGTRAALCIDDKEGEGGLRPVSLLSVYAYVCRHVFVCVYCLGRRVEFMDEFEWLNESKMAAWAELPRTPHLESIQTQREPESPFYPPA